MKSVTKMTSEERKKAFAEYLKDIKTGSQYIKALEKGFAEAPILECDSIFDIADPDFLEDLDNTKDLRATKAFTRSSTGGTFAASGLKKYIQFLKDSRDSYYSFMKHFGIKDKDLLEWGVSATIFPEKKLVAKEWESLKRRITNDERVYIRKYGHDGAGTQLYMDFYKDIFKNDHIVATKNYGAQAIIKRTTGYKTNEDIYNYQVSHVWSRTKNIYLYEAPWNICYTPKIIDPLTGHETKGDLPRRFQEQFQLKIWKKYKKYIDDYNEIITNLDIPSQLKKYCRDNGISLDESGFYGDALKELSPIIVEKSEK